MKLMVIALLGMGLLGGAPTWAASPASTAVARVVACYPHDPGAFTEGLVVAGQTVFESTGRNGRSTLRRVDLASGRIERERKLVPRYFAEGLALAHGRLYQLTWKAGRAFVYSSDSLEHLQTLHYAGQGWGLTWDGRHLVMSDGSATLRVLDRGNFAVVRRINVTRDNHPVTGLNELEYIDGQIWANVWFSDLILRIDPANGQVVSALDAHDLRRYLPGGAQGVLNGIAFDAGARRLYVTGKNWPTLFELAYPPWAR